MANCHRCGQKLPFLSWREICAPCRESMARFSKQSIYADPFPRLTDSEATMYITIGLLAVNGIAFLAMILSGASPMSPDSDTLMRFGGSWGPLSLGEQPWRLLSSVFLHGGFIHIAMNMWCLWDLGGLAERVFDRWVYFLIYIACGLSGSLVAVGWSPLALTIGASGAIFGIAGALISALYLGNLPIGKSAIQGTVKSLISFAAYSLFFGAIVPHISNSAHIGGLIMGVVLGAVLAPSMTSTAAKRQIWALVVLVAAGFVLFGGFVFLRHANADLLSLRDGVQFLRNYSLI